MRPLAVLLLTVLVAIPAAYAVEVIVDTSQAPDLRNFGSQVQKTLVDWYPYISDYLKSPTYKDVSTIYVFFDNNYDGVAYAQNTRIVGATNYYRNHQDDIGSMVHEMTHVIQKYQNCPGWVTEGVADYMRYYHLKDKQLPKPGPNNYYTQGYWVTAYFFNYVVQRVRGDMIKWVNKDCREGTYADSIWPRLTNKNLDTLWNEMLRNGYFEFLELFREEAPMATYVNVMDYQFTANVWSPHQYCGTYFHLNCADNMKEAQKN